MTNKIDKKFEEWWAKPSGTKNYRGSFRSCYHAAYNQALKDLQSDDVVEAVAVVEWDDYAESMYQSDLNGDYPDSAELVKWEDAPRWVDKDSFRNLAKKTLQAAKEKLEGE